MIFDIPKMLPPYPLYGVPIITVLLILKGNDAQRVHRPRKLDKLLMILLTGSITAP